jgi:hypothetical protein
MQNFLDLPGVSGVTYRFQRVEDLGQLPAIAGNFVYVRGKGPKMSIVCCGTDETLLHAADKWPNAVQEHGAEAIFVRRNISWKTRAHEHADLIERHQPRMVLAAELKGLS